jgi:hypothetical protein
MNPSQLVGGRKSAEPLEQTLDHVDLRLRKRCVDPDAPRRHPVSRRRLDHMASRRTSEVGVVEDDPLNARRQLVVELTGKVSQRASTLVAIEAEVAAGDVLLGQTTLSGPWDPHEEDHLVGT